MTRDDLRAVTDHVVIRYMERHMRLDLDLLRKTIAYETAAARIASLEMPEATIECTAPAGHRYILRDGVVVTMIARPTRKRRRNRRRHGHR